MYSALGLVLQLCNADLHLRGRGKLLQGLCSWELCRGGTAAQYDAVQCSTGIACLTEGEEQRKLGKQASPSTTVCKANKA